MPEHSLGAVKELAVIGQGNEESVDWHRDMTNFRDHGHTHLLQKTVNTNGFPVTSTPCTKVTAYVCHLV